MQGSFRGLSGLATTASLRSKHDDSHFIEEETEAQKGQGTSQSCRARKGQSCTVNQGCGPGPSPLSLEHKWGPKLSKTEP